MVVLEEVTSSHCVQFPLSDPNSKQEPLFQRDSAKSGRDTGLWFPQRWGTESFVSIEPICLWASSFVLLLLLLSRFSRVRLCATPEMAARMVLNVTLVSKSRVDKSSQKDKMQRLIHIQVKEEAGEVHFLGDLREPWRQRKVSKDWEGHLRQSKWHRQRLQAVGVSQETEETAIRLNKVMSVFPQMWPQLCGDNCYRCSFPGCIPGP